MLRGEAGLAGGSSSLDGHLERAGHAHGIFGHGNGGVDQHCVSAEFERFRSVAGSAEAGVDNDGDAGLFDDDGNLGAGFESAIAPDGRTERHDRGRTGVFETLGQNGIGVDVGKHGETFGGEDLRGAESFDRIGQEILRVGVDFEFHPLGQSGGRREPGETHCFVRVHRAARVGEEEIFFRIDEIEDVGERIIAAAEIGAPQGHGDNFRAAGGQRIAHEFIRGELAGAEKEARFEGAPGDDQRLTHGTGDAAGAAGSPSTSS